MTTDQQPPSPPDVDPAAIPDVDPTADLMPEAAVPAEPKTYPHKSGTELLAVDDRQRETVQVPEWQAAVTLRTPTAAARDEYEAGLLTGKGKNREVNMRNARAKLVALCAVDPKDQPLWSPAQVVALGNKAAPVLDRLFDVAQRLTGIGLDEIEDLAKN